MDPLIAYIFLGSLDLKRSNQLFMLKSYQRYDDDVFVITDPKSEVQKLHMIMDNLHPNINFNMEIEKERILPFINALNIRELIGAIKRLIYNIKRHGLKSKSNSKVLIRPNTNADL